MRKFLKFLLVSATMGLAGFSQPADAGLVGMPRNLRATLDRIQFETPTLPPMAFTLFCMRYESECKPRRMVFRGGPVRLTDERWADLEEVNLKVNRSIRPERNVLGVAGEEWVINPSRGDCNDYAVTKRHQLLKRGWPARSLLLSEVVVPSGEHHLVLVVRTNRGDVVLDNLTSRVQSWNRTAYQWVRVQSPGNPHIWSRIAPRGV
jgi:predicted transglutaminase-like cysteine proteinase